MKQLLIAAAAFGLLAHDVHARNDELSMEERETLRQLQEAEPRDEHSRLVAKSRRVVREPHGDRVVITRRTYEDPAGVRSVRETRRPMESR
jgi:hypothetical protein